MIDLHKLFRKIEEAENARDVIEKVFAQELKSGFKVNEATECFSNLNSYINELEVEKNELIRLTNPIVKSCGRRTGLHEDVQSGFSL